eukprot:TRINITY_DN9890_c0_g1_i1.p1 TRINITY_DN9890_c0_g1~~TRINITY_DN9890_c0_g1_i1.p1  ORF type:complete len:284 (-),score=28.71 TRINITY_DN9890_c0_g1_i1:250-1101(-)
MVCTERIHSVSSLPLELGMIIFGDPCLSVRDLLRIGLTCKAWNGIVSRDTCWYASYQNLLRNESCHSLKVGLPRGQWREAVLSYHKEICARSKQGRSEFRVLLLGAARVGKTLMVDMFVNQKFSAKYDPTIEDNYPKECTIDGLPCVLDIMDVAGPENFQALVDSYMKTMHGFLIVYSVTDSRSLGVAEKFYKDVLRVHSDKSNMPVVLVGNKIDREDEREVSQAKGKELAEKWSAGWIETSVKIDHNVTEAFFQLAIRMYAWQSTHKQIPKQEFTKRRCALS